MQSRQKASICGQGLKLDNYDYNTIIEEGDKTDCTNVCFIRDHILVAVQKSLQRQPTYVFHQWTDRA